MNAQLLRIVIAGALSLVSLVGVVIVSVLSQPVPFVLQYSTAVSLAYLFGVTTNGTGLGGLKRNGGGK